MSNTKRQPSVIDQIIARHNGPTASVVQKAVELQKEREEKEQAEAIIENINVIRQIEGCLVGELKQIRAAEKRKKNQLTEFNKASEQFMKDGDWDAFNQKIGTVGLRIVRGTVIS